MLYIKCNSPKVGFSFHFRSKIAEILLQSGETNVTIALHFVGSCAFVWELCHRVGICTVVWESAPLCEKLRLCVGICAFVWESAPLCEKLRLYVGLCHCVKS